MTIANRGLDWIDIVIWNRPPWRLVVGGQRILVPLLLTQTSSDWHWIGGVSCVQFIHRRDTSVSPYSILVPRLLGQLSPSDWHMIDTGLTLDWHDLCQCAANWWQSNADVWRWHMCGGGFWWVDGKFTYYWPIGRGLAMDWHRIFTGLPLNWLLIDIMSAPNWHKIGAALAIDWHRIGRKKSRIGLGLMSDGLDRQRIGDRLVLDWESIDSAVYRIGNALT